MTPEQIQQTLEMVTQKLGPPAKYAFELAVRQAKTEGYMAAGCFVIFGGISTICGLKAKSAMKRLLVGDLSNNDEFPYWLGFWIFGAISGICLFPTLINLYNAFWYLLNPEWQAIRFLMGGRL